MKCECGSDLVRIKQGRIVRDGKYNTVCYGCGEEKRIDIKILDDAPLWLGYLEEDKDETTRA